MTLNALGLGFVSAAQLSKRPGSVWNCLWGNALTSSAGINSKSRVSYPGPGFLSSATWPSLPKKHYNGLNQTIRSPLLQQKYSLLFRERYDSEEECIKFETMLVCSGSELNIGLLRPKQY